MLDPESTVQRFSRHIVVRDPWRRSGPIYQSVHFLENFMQVLIADDDSNGSDIEMWSHVFLKGILNVPMVYVALIRYGLHADDQDTTSIVTNQPLALVNPPLGSHGTLNVSALLSLHHTLCHRLLFCYLQPICWKVGLQVSQQLKRSPNTALHYPHQDCFAIACYQSTRPDALLRRFDFNANTSLNGYAFGALQKATKNQIAQELKSKSIKFSNYGLLRQVSQRRMERSLTSYGFPAEKQQPYLLVWTLFKHWANDMGLSGRSSLGRSLTTEQTEAIAILCEQRCQQLQINLSISPQQVRSMLETCTKAVHLEEGKPTTSLDNPMEQLFEPVSGYAEPMMTQEQQATIEELRQTIQTALETLDGTARQALCLWLGLGLNQIDFTSLLQVERQFQVARHFQRYQRTIFKATMQAYQRANPDANLTDEIISERCKSQLAIVKEYLEQYSQRLFAEELEALVLTGKAGEAQSPLLSFTVKLAALSPTARQNTSMSEEATRLKTQFKRKIEQQFSLPLEQFASWDKRVDDFIKVWLVNHQALLY